MFKEFKEFAFKGNMVDMAIGIILGGAFGILIKSLVDHILMPLVSGLLKLPDFSRMFYAMDGKVYETLEAAQKAGPTISYGMFINNFMNLLIIAFALFIAVKYVMGALAKKEEEESDPDPQEVLLTEIRDLLKK